MKLKILLLILIMISCVPSKRLFKDKELNIFNDLYTQAIKDNKISTHPKLFYNDSLIVDLKQIDIIISKLKFEEVSSFSIIDSNYGQKIFGLDGSNGLMFIISKDFLMNIPITPDSTKFKNVKMGNEPIIFLDNVSIDNSKFKSLNPMDIASIEVLKNQTTKLLFKERNVDGLVFITSKNYAIKYINSVFGGLNNRYKNLNAQRIDKFERLLFKRDSIWINNEKGYVGKIYNDLSKIKSLDIIDSQVAKQRFDIDLTKFDYVIELK